MSCECGRPEYAELVERLVSATRRADIAEHALRQRMEHREDAGYVRALQARIVELEDIVRRQNENLMRRAS